MKKFKPFADVVKTISTDKFKPVMAWAIVEGARLISTDAHTLSVISLKNYIDDPDQLKNIEGKIFDAATCKKLAAADHLTFLENEIVIKVKNDLSRIFYPGFIDAAGILTPIDAATGEASAYTVGKYPNWRAVVPHYKNDIFDFSELKPGPICFSAAKIAAAAAALNSDFLHFFTSEPNRPGLIFTTQNIEIEKKKVSKIDFESFVLIMPVIHEDTKSFHKTAGAGPNILEAEEISKLKKENAEKFNKILVLENEVQQLREGTETLKKELYRRIEADKAQPAEPAKIEAVAVMIANQPAGILAPVKKPKKKKKEAAAVTAFYNTVNRYKAKRAAGKIEI